MSETNVLLTLYLLQTKRLPAYPTVRVKIIEGDVNDYQKLEAAISNQDIVYDNLGGQFEPMLKNIVTAMEFKHVARLIHVSGLGLYYEVPGEFGDWVEGNHR